jgi:hypothetical protein
METTSIVRDEKKMFDESISILVQAFLNGTLLHSNCAACAVGNIIAAKIQAKVIVSGKRSDFFSLDAQWIRGASEIQPIWDEVFCTNGTRQDIDPDAYKGWAKRQIDTTGYSWQELARIEKAFESVPYSIDEFNSEDHMYRGLMAVVEVLASIHGIDLEEKENAKLLFVKA